MASSKFSRPPPAQQPPPRCRKPPPPGGLPPPPPHGPTLHFIATFDGLDSDGDPFNRSIQNVLDPVMPSDFYTFTGPDPFPWMFFIALHDPIDQTFEWDTYWVITPSPWAGAHGHVYIPDAPPVDTGIINADATNPVGQAATVRFFTVPL